MCGAGLGLSCPLMLLKCSAICYSHVQCFFGRRVFSTSWLSFSCSFHLSQETQTQTIRSLCSFGNNTSCLPIALTIFYYLFGSSAWSYGIWILFPFLLHFFIGIQVRGLVVLSVSVM